MTAVRSFKRLDLNFISVGSYRPVLLVAKQNHLIDCSHDPINFLFPKNTKSIIIILESYLKVLI